jgi:hypothetical protein
MTDQVLQRAIGFVQQATDEDQKQNFAEAFRLYQLALEYFMHYLKCMCLSLTPLHSTHSLTH